MAGWVHVLSFLSALLTSWIVGFGGMLPAFLVWLVQEDRQGLVAKNAAYAFNLNFSLFVYSAVSIVFVVLTLGIGVLVAAPFWILLALWWCVASIKAARQGFLGSMPSSSFLIRVL